MAVIHPNPVSPENIVLQELQTRGQAVSLHDIVTALSSKQVINSKRTAKEIIWKLVEEGKARFTDDWLIEAKS